MKKYFIETSVVVGFLRGKKESIDVIKSLEGEMVSSYIALCELYEGIFRSHDRKKTEVGVIDFFKALSEVFGVDEEISKKFGQVRSQFRKKGNAIEDLDILLGATCLAYGLTMVTLNKRHFERIPGLELFNF